jgi:hypothetical protein
MVAVYQLVRGALRFSKEYLETRIVTGDGEQFTVFRHMHLRKENVGRSDAPTVFVVRFKFAKFSYKTNRVLSCIPILFIAGFPGFRDKLWMVNEEDGYWQGVYQWDTARCVEDYQGSFVLSMMTRRAIPETVSHEILPNTSLKDYMDAKSAAHHH